MPLKPRARARQAAPLPTRDEAAALCGAGLAEVLLLFVYERVEVRAAGARL